MMSAYDFSLLYHQEESFFSRWVAHPHTQRAVVFVRKERYLWVDGTLINLPSQAGEYVIGDGLYAIAYHEDGHVYLGVR